MYHYNFTRTFCIINHTELSQKQFSVSWYTGMRFLHFFFFFFSSGWLFAHRLVSSGVVFMVKKLPSPNFSCMNIFYFFFKLALYFCVVCDVLWFAMFLFVCCATQSDHRRWPVDWQSGNEGSVLQN